MKKKVWSKYGKKIFLFNFLVLTIMIYKYYLLLSVESEFFSSLFNFFRGEEFGSLLDRLGHWGQKLYACQGWKFANEIPLGGNLGGQVENVYPWGQKKGRVCQVPRSNSMAFVTSQLETLGMIEQPVWL